MKGPKNSIGHIQSAKELETLLSLSKTNCALDLIAKDMVQAKPAGPEESRGDEALYHHVFQSVGDGVLFLDQDGMLTKANPAARSIFNLGKGKLWGVKASALFSPKDTYKIDLCLDRARRLNKGSKFKSSHTNKDQRTIHTLVQAQPFAVKNKRGIILIIRDTTQRDHVEERLRQARIEAESSDIAKSQFLANISHEFRTPMNVILGYAGMLKDSDLNEEIRERFVDSILDNGNALVKLIDKVLDISKVEAGSFKIEKETIPLYPQVLEVIKIVKGQCAHKNIDVELDFKCETTLQVKTDPMRMKQVLLNLLENGIKFTGEGRVTLRIFHGIGERLVFQVLDTGIGIPKEEWKRLFNPFSQVDESMTRNYGGIGLGLAVSKHLAQALGGNLYLKKSIPGRGSIFEFWINSPYPAAIGTERRGDAKDLASKFENLKNANILLVEDMKENQALIKMYLRQLDCKLDIASDGYEALELLSRKKYDLILMDLQMPKLDGFGATHLIRKQGLKTPIIALTAHAMKEDVERCMRSGFDAHLSKPVRSKDLLLKVRKHCLSFG